MAATKETVITEFHVMANDPGRPDRTAAWHLNALDVVTWEDGSLHFGQHRQYNMEAAIAAGFDLPAIAAALNARSQADLETAEAAVQRLTGDLADLQGQHTSLTVNHADLMSANAALAAKAAADLDALRADLECLTGEHAELQGSHADLAAKNGDLATINSALATKAKADLETAQADIERLTAQLAEAR